MQKIEKKKSSFQKFYLIRKNFKNINQIKDEVN